MPGKIIEDFRKDRKCAGIGDGTIEFRPGENAVVEVFLAITDETDEEPDAEVASIIVEYKGTSKAYEISFDEIIELAIKAGLFEEEGETEDAKNV